ncbi:MAG: flavoprotein [Planctomycetota bacterium]|jgi:phosphopantothenoylcysteine decarboxylase/phosphopantothenate--cysteine ligase
MAKKKSNLDGLNVLLGVSGGVSAYKSVDLASRQTAAGTVVKTVITENACKLVKPKSFEAVTGSVVYTSLWTQPGEYRIGHIELVDWADIVVVAPATANIIGKLTNGICDDILSTILCVCWNIPTILAPAMNNNMWTSPAVVQNIKTLKQRGITLIGPEKGRLACGTDAIGRMSQPKDIIKVIEKIARDIKRKK